MCELEAVLTAHAARYPQMLPQDAVKLIYQNEFGGGHMISDSAVSLKRLQTEYSTVTPDPHAPLLEEIGGGMVRVMLAALQPEDYPLAELNAGFVRSAARHTGSRERFLQKLEALRRLTRQGVFSFSPQELDTYLVDYRAAGFPIVSHSERYRAAYRPAYRVLCAACLLPGPVIRHAIRQKAAPVGRPLLIAIDGRCASGKTTLAAGLQARYGWPVIHMDDFFLRPEQRSQARYDTPGENIDHERFLSEVLRPLLAGQAAVYRPFDCSAMELGAPVALPPAPIIVVEGSYSCHPALWPCYDLRVFLSVEPQEQLRRVSARNGAYAEVFQHKWIPLEAAYFSAFHVAEHCEFAFE